MSKKYRFCFAGLGSIATRHIKNLHEIMEERGAECEIDLLRSGQGAPVKDEISGLINRIYYNAEDLSGKYDAFFVTNPTSKHLEVMELSQDAALNYFVEKPVFHSSEVDRSNLDLEGKQCYVACPLRYTGAIDYIKENIPPESIRSMRVVSASYLPDWRPGTDYRKTYSARKELGGGVSIDLIHEWDYITYIMGVPRSVKAMIDRVSDLEIDSDDIAVYMGQYDSCIVEVHLDYFTRKPIRRIEITTDEDTIVADLIGQTLKYAGRGEEICFDSERDAFQRRELEHFLDIIEGKAENTNSIENAIEVLKIAEGKEF